MYIFLETTGGARTNIYSGMLVMNKEQFLDRLREVKIEKWSGYDYRYAELGTDTANFKSMPLDVFEKIFTPEECTQIPLEFYQKHTLKVVDAKYGKRYYDSLIPALKGKDLTIYKGYVDYDNCKFIYLGKWKNVNSEKIVHLILPEIWIKHCVNGDNLAYYTYHSSSLPKFKGTVPEISLNGFNFSSGDIIKSNRCGYEYQKV